MSENEVIDELNAAAAEVHEPENMSVAMDDIDRGKIKYLSLDAVDFNPALNIRDVTLQQQRVDKKVIELMGDKYIRTALVVTIPPNPPEGFKPQGACGFLRWHALKAIQQTNPSFFKEYFEGKIPFKVVTNCNTGQRERLMYDHGLEEGLSEAEIYMAFVRLLRTNRYTEAQLSNIMSKMFYSMMSADDRQRYNQRIAEIAKNGTVIVSNALITDVETLRAQQFRGRTQYFKRIATACAPSTYVEKYYLRNLAGDPDTVSITYQIAQQLAKFKTEAEAREYLENIARAQSKGDKKAGRIWAVGQLTRALQTTRSAALRTQLSAALGSDEEANKLPDLDDQLLRIETAQQKDAVRFWAAIDAINLAP